MDFSLTDEQRMLQDTVDRLVSDAYTFDNRGKFMQEAQGFKRENWTQLAELGLLGVPFSEEAGGFGGGAVETMLIMEAFGKGLVLEPYIATVLTSGTLIADAGSEDQRDGLLDPLISGELLLAFAHGEPGNRYSVTRVETTAKRDAGGYTINGHKSVVMHGDSADHFLVSTRTDGDVDDAEGLSLFLVPAGADGVTVKGYRTMDGLHAADVHFKNVKVADGDLVGEQGKAAALIELTLDRGAFAVCAEAVGAMSVACDLTLDYLKQRKQFGVHIGSFQSLQHRMVEMRMGLEQVRSITMKAAAKMEGGDPEQRRQAISAAKVLVGEAGRFVAEQAIQLHGGIGMTEEYSLPHYAKRLIMIGHQYGDADFHLARYADAMDLADSA